VRGVSFGEARPARRDSGVHGHSISFRCLLDLDADLADELDPESRRVARAAATALTFELESGPVSLAYWLDQVGDGPGVLLLDGVLALSSRVGDRVATELLGTGDLLQPLWGGAERLLSYEVAWRALAPMRFALLDGAFVKRVRFWPEIGLALLRRAGRRAVNLDVQRAIAAQPRLEVRLALLLWHLAGRWGKVEPGGVRLPLPLTHQLLGQLVGAERPSVSHALARLAEGGFVIGRGDQWHLRGSIEQTLPSMIDPVVERADRIVATVGARRARRATACEPGQLR
jgi:CRP/FNR family transcriptional regulator, cyclic AMP receptor protein